MFSPKWLLIYILVFAFLVRVAGINYGLPLWLIDDEPPFTLAALKMIQLKTLLPASYLEEFRTVLYYPPYLSYLYLLPFSILLGIKYLLFSGGREQFIYYLTSDLSQFFLIARFFNVLMGVVSVYLLYRVAKNILRQEAPALLAAFFLTTSLFHILMSTNGRHWLPVSFFTILVLWILNLDWEFRLIPRSGTPDPAMRDLGKRYLAAVLAVGVGVGVSPINVLLLILIAVWYLFYEQRNLSALIKEKYFYGSLVIFAWLAILPGALYPQSFGFRGDLTFQETKSILGIVTSLFIFLKPVVLSEPILAFFAVLGLLFTVFHRRNLFWPVFLFIYAYSAIFYLFFRYEHRFTLPVFPILAIMAAYGVAESYKRINSRILIAILILILAMPAVFSLRLSYLLYQNDSRNHLIEWTQANIPSGSKILVYARLTRLPATPEAIKEQRIIDSGSLRKVDLAEENFPKQPSFHALNLYTIQNQEFYSGLENYAKKQKYQYLLTSQIDFEKNPAHFNRIQSIASRGALLESFGEFQERYSPYIGQLLGNPFNLFKIKEFGPPVALYKLP
ncbi:MAG: glycosyltransferase family 39 protein [Candidatus Harrisonbacteria bacterium]|nr:glycosyltransferase family 39 protein [Candidatus Harrisonbacteria bacterium]